MERAFEAQERVDGTIFGRVKGGFTVDLAGATAPPGQQVDIRPVKDVAHLLGISAIFNIKNGQKEETLSSPEGLF